jgi:signal transduction histidine kinase
LLVVALESIALFHNLDPSELSALRLITQERSLAAGQEIFREGDPGDGVYFVKDGLVEISGLVGGESRRVFSQLDPGEIFGEMAVIEQRLRSATATAVKDAEVYFIPRGEMLSLIQRSPVLAFTLLQQISHRLREFNQLHLREIVQAESLAVVGRFAQSIVHDLKNPLSIIALCAETFDMPTVKSEIRAKAKGRIKKQVERINDMVSDILIFTERKQTDAELKPGDFRAFVLELFGDLRAEAEFKAAHIELENEPPAVLVAFDPRRLSRIFFNLVGNATDMMRSGGKIYLRFHRDEKEIVTEIEDTGPGIAPVVSDKLFQPFTTHGKEHGTGLGLSICKKIIEDHQGRIWVRNEAGHGAIFCFALPLAK